MNRYLGAAALALPFVALSQADAQERPYGSVSGGYLVADDVSGTVLGIPTEVDFEDGFAVSAAGGYAFGNGFRAEAEIFYGNVELDSVTTSGVRADASGEVDIYTGTINAFYDLPTGTGLVPYVGAGAGVAHMEGSDLDVASARVVSDDSTDPIVLGEIGLRYDATSNLSVGAAYRYNHIFNGEDDTDDSTAHLVKLSLMFSF